MSKVSSARVRVVVLVVAALFIALGIYRNEVQVMFNKSVRICLECIGLG